MTQPVKIKRFKDEYDQKITQGIPKTPLEAGIVLCKEDEGENDLVLSPEAQTLYRLLTALMIRMMRWLRVEMMNAVRECSWFMTEVKVSRNKHLQQIMTYCMYTSFRGVTIAPNEIWDET